MGIKYEQQIEEAFLKLQQASVLSMEAMRQFYDAKIESLRNVERTEESPKPIYPRVIKEVKKEQQKQPIIKTVEVKDTEDKSVTEKPKEPERKKPRLMFCRDCHKQITGEAHDIGNNLAVCDSCFKKRKMMGLIEESK